MIVVTVKEWQCIFFGGMGFGAERRCWNGCRGMSYELLLIGWMLCKYNVSYEEKCGCSSNGTRVE